MLTSIIQKSIQLFITVLLLLTACKNEKPNTPVAETANNPTSSIPDTAAFMAQLRTAFQQRDAALMGTLLADTLTSGFADGAGPCPHGCPKAEVIQHFFAGKNAEGWKQFDLAIRFGAGAMKDENGQVYYKAPGFPDQDKYNEKMVYIYGNNVNVREKPSKTAKVLTKLSACWKPDDHDIVNKWVDNGEYDFIGWVPVYYEKGKLGYVFEEFTNQAFFGTITIKPDNNGRLRIMDITYDAVCAL